MQAHPVGVTVTLRKSLWGGVAESPDGLSPPLNTTQLLVKGRTVHQLPPMRQAPPSAHQTGAQQCQEIYTTGT